MVEPAVSSARRRPAGTLYKALDKDMDDTARWQLTFSNCMPARQQPAKPHESVVLATLPIRPQLVHATL